MKKTFFLIMAAMMMAAGARAQKMVVKTTDQQMVMYDIPNVESVSFVDGYVDLGLPSGTLWATCNVGASSPEEYGDFFAWGETEPKSEYAWTNYFDYDADDASNRYKKYNNDGGLTELLPEDDAATVNWGEGWQTPSMEQFEELIDPSNTTTVWLEQNGVYGRMVIGKNSQYIFLPAAGFRWGTSYNGAGSDGYYWSRTLNASSNSMADYLLFGSGSISSLYSGRGMGFSVRPVVCGANQIQKIPVTGIVLNYSTLSLQPDATQQLTATVEPEDASNKAVMWTSSDATVATVSTGGLVTAKAEGTCTITCTAKDGSGVKTECHVTVSEVHLCPNNNHPHMIDLGLPSGTKWACCNVGASNPTGYGGYYAWGETSEKSEYSWSTYFDLEASDPKTNTYLFKKYNCNIYNWYVMLQPEDDAATVNWGNSWQMPNASQLGELIEKCSKVWTQLNGVNGLLVTGPNGGQIFLPAAGWRLDDKLSYAGEDGCYWSNTVGSEFQEDHIGGALDYDKYGSCDITFETRRDIGCSVRAVRK